MCLSGFFARLTVILRIRQPDNSFIRKRPKLLGISGLCMGIRGCLIMLFLERARQWAEENRIAAIDQNGEAMSFAQLNQWSDSLAVWLHEEGTSPVAIWCDKENLALAAMLACVKAGRAYVMMAIFYPPERVRQILESSGAKLILSLNNAPMGEVDVPVADTEQIRSVLASHRTPEPDWCLKNDDLLYFVYTSGSTNQPKCVGHTLGNMLANTFSHEPIFSFVRDGRYKSLNFSPYAYEFCQEQIYFLLYQMGVTLLGISRALSVEYNRFLDVVYQTQPNLFFGTPSLMATFLANPDFSQKNLPGARMFVLAGEATTAVIAKKIFERFPSARLFSDFGSSETMLAGISEITPELAGQSELMPLGNPVTNITWRVLDENNEPVPQGQTGRLAVYSGGVAKNYQNNPELSARVFLDDENGHGILTNDRVFLAENGYYYYAGRMDNVVKIGGYRVDLDETERILLRCPMVSHGAVAPSMRDGKADSVTAFVVLEQGYVPSLKTIAEIKKYLKEASLAPYMIPKKFIFMDSLPKNINGKLDRRALRDYQEKN